MTRLKCGKCKTTVMEIGEDSCITKVKKVCPKCGYLNTYRLSRNEIYTEKR